MAIRDLHLKPRLGCKEKLFKRRPSSLLQPAPLIDRHQDCCLNTPLRNDLRPLRDALFEQLAKSSLRFLYRPTHHRSPVMTSMLTSHYTQRAQDPSFVGKPDAARAGIWETKTPPASASASIRAAMLTPSP